MRTRSSSNLVGESSPNPTTLNLKRHNRRRSKQPFSLEESPLDTMADQRTMAELLRAPTEGYVDAIVVPPILTEHFELKHSLMNMMTSDQFFRLEKDNPHDHIQLQDNIQGLVSAAMVNYNQGNSGYRPPSVANQIRPLGFAQPNVQNNQNRFIQPQGYNQGNNFNQDKSYQALIQQNQVVSLKEDERVNETLTDPKLAEYSIKVPPPLVQKAKPLSIRNYVVHQRDPHHPHILYP
uniref:Reverse transcriptase domain-containing protein n=1 Tax=Tanacetum cinerariifolium TaxID=118510 RepID=A0A699K9N3_TANCI|nr:reverse transcriptase domain-containing protein [Tanacetum cinerariifolium]